MKRLAKYHLFLIMSIAIWGCSKPTESTSEPVLTEVSLTDTINAYYDGCQVNVTLIYKIQNYSGIKSGSDSDRITVYLNNGKILTEPSNEPGVQSDEYYLGLFTRTTYDSWVSDTTSVLAASDTLTTVDSSAVNIWWWYNGVRRTLHYKF
jgi:hypothetical protein